VSLGATACGAPCERLVPCVTRRGSRPGSDADVAEPRRGPQVVEPKAKACAPRAALRLALACPVVVLTPPTRAPACAPACYTCDQRTACRFTWHPGPLRRCVCVRTAALCVRLRGRAGSLQRRGSLTDPGHACSGSCAAEPCRYLYTWGQGRTTSEGECGPYQLDNRPCASANAFQSNSRGKLWRGWSLTRRNHC